MAILISLDDLKKLSQRKRRPKRMRPVKSPALAERELKQRLEELWRRILFPANGKIAELIKRGAPPSEIADFMDSVLRQTQWRYGLMADDVVYRWQLSVNDLTRLHMKAALTQSLGVDITAVLDTPAVADALRISGMEAANLIKTIPSEYLGRVAEAVAKNFRGIALPEGRSLLEEIQEIGQVSRKRARLIARDQTSKATGVLDMTRQQSIGITEYVWRTSKDQRVTGNPTGKYPVGNPKHMDHYHREGKVFRWDSPPPDGHPGQAIQCRCTAQAVIDINKIILHAQAA